MSDPLLKPKVRAYDRSEGVSRRPSAGDTDFDQAVALHYQQIRLLAYRLMGWHGDIDDVVQDVFLAAWAAWPRLRKYESAELWLKRIAVNKCRSRLRRQAVRNRWFGWMRVKIKNQRQTTDELSLEKVEQSERIREAVRSLAPAYRETTVLYYLEQMSIDEIAEMLGVRRNTVEVRLHRSRGQLENILADMME
jgi:RNA polymerase sigma factor (sigma-70 family)